MFEPSIIDRARKTWNENKGTILGAGAGLTLVGVASTVANILHSNKMLEYQKQRDAKSDEMQRSSLQNQIATTTLLDELVHKTSSPVSP